jgi:hypothetical protein
VVHGFLKRIKARLEAHDTIRGGFSGGTCRRTELRGLFELALCSLVEGLELGQLSLKNGSGALGDLESAGDLRIPCRDGVESVAKVLSRNDVADVFLFFTREGVEGLLDTFDTLVGLLETPTNAVELLGQGVDIGVASQATVVECLGYRISNGRL